MNQPKKVKINKLWLTRLSWIKWSCQHYSKIIQKHFKPVCPNFYRIFCSCLIYFYQRELRIEIFSSITTFPHYTGLIVDILHSTFTIILYTKTRNIGIRESWLNNYAHYRRNYSLTFKVTWRFSSWVSFHYKSL